MFLYSPPVLDHCLHCLVCSVHVHNPPRLAPAKQVRIQPHFPFLFPFACVRLKHFLRPLRITQPCRWSRECPSGSVFAFSFILSHLIQHRTSGSCGAISCHTHIYTLSFPFPLSLLCAFAFPSGMWTCFGPDLFPNSLAVWCGLSICNTGLKSHGHGRDPVNSCWNVGDDKSVNMSIMNCRSFFLSEESAAA